MTFGRSNSIFICSLCLLLMGPRSSIAEVQAIETGFDSLQSLSRASGDAAPAPRVAAASSPVARDSSEDIDGTVVDAKELGGAEDHSKLGRELLRRIVKARPSLLENEEMTREWMRVLGAGGYWPGAGLWELYIAYTKGTEFDQERALGTFRKFISSQATDEPLKILRIRKVRLGKYDRESSAFPLHAGDLHFQKTVTYSWGASPQVEGKFDELPDLDWLPIPPGEAEAFVKQLGKERSVDVAMRFTLHDFSSKPGSIPGYTSAAATVESVSVHACCQQKGRLGTLITRLPVEARNEAVTAPPVPAAPGYPAEKVVEKEPAGQARGKSDTLAAIGLPVVNGIVDFRFGGAMLSDREKETGRAIVRLALLLALRENPSLIDDPANTISFVKLLPDELAKRYVDKIRLIISPHQTYDENEWHIADGSQIGWRGRDEFERRDTRDRFLREQKDRILALVPELPIEVAFDQGLGLGEYDSSTESFPIDGGWGSGGFYMRFETSNIGIKSLHKVIVAPPLRYARHWRMTEKDARSFREVQRKHAELTKAEARSLMGNSGTPPRPLYLRTRYLVTGLRLLDKQLVLETALRSLEVVGRKDLSHPIAKLPIPDGSYTVDASEKGNPYWTADSKDPVAALDPFLASLIVARTKPERLDDPAALSSAFHIRQRFELGVFDSKAATQLSRFMTPALLAGNIERSPTPSTDDLSRFKAWLAEQSRALDKDIRLSRSCEAAPVPGSRAGRGNATPSVGCRVNFAESKDGQLVINPLAMLDLVGNQPGFDIYAPTWRDPTKKSEDDWHKAAREVARSKYPAAANFKILPSGQVAPVIVALHPSTHWYGVAIGGAANEFESISVDFAIRESSFLPYAPGKEFLLIDIEPTVVRYKRPGENLVTVKLESEPSATPASSDSGAVGHYEFLGVKLGMGLAEAQAALQSALPGKTYTFRAEQRNDSIFGNAIAYGDFHQDNWGGSFRQEKVTLFFDPTHENKPVIAVGRRTKFEKEQFKDDASVHQAITPTLFEKYGQPDVYKFASYDYIYWAVSPITKARLKRRDRGLRSGDPCSHFEFRGFYDSPKGGGAFRSIPGGTGCGEMLSAEVFTSELKLFLVDTDVFPAVRGRIAESGKPSTAVPTISKPDSVALLEAPDRKSSDVDARVPVPDVTPEPPPAPAVAALPPQPSEPAMTPAPTDRSFDIVGLRLGMDVAAAEGVVRTHMDVAHKLNFLGASRQMLVPFGNATVFVRKDNGEYIALLTEPSRSGTRVVAIGRYLAMGLGAFDKTEFISDLEQKFGPAPLRSEEFLYWGGSSDRRTDNPCLVRMGGLGDAGTWTDESGATPDLTRLIPPGAKPGIRGPASMPWIGLRILDLQQASAYRGCGPTVSAWVPDLNGRTGEFAVWLTDTKAYIDILSGPVLSPDEPKAKVKF
jgi:hypothetical protein